MNKNTIYFYQLGLIEIVEGRGMPRFPYHTHESYLVGVIKSGKAEFTIRDKNYTLTGGDSYLVPSGTGLSITPASPYEYLTICIKGRYKEDLLSCAGVIPGIGSQIIAMCDRLKLNKDSDKFVSELAKLLQSDMPKSLSCGKDNALVSDAKQYINAHLNDDIHLGDISKGIHISKYYLIRAFRRHTGITPMQYLVQTRLRCAKFEILSGKAMKDIAYDLNFSAQSHLCTIFKKYMGISIRDYKSSVTKIEQ